MMTQVEAAPRSVNYWMKLGPDGEEESVTPGRKIRIMDIDENAYTQRMVLRMEEVRLRDFGTYICIARNSLGDVRANVQLQGAQFHVFGFLYNSFLIESARCGIRGLARMILLFVHLKNILKLHLRGCC